MRYFGFRFFFLFSNAQKRVDVFIELLNKNKFDKVIVDADQSEQLVKIMDIFVILLEGGTESDFQVLESNEGKPCVKLIREIQRFE